MRWPVGSGSLKRGFGSGGGGESGVGSGASVAGVWIVGTG
jgi:hypothetical protein